MFKSDGGAQSIATIDCSVDGGRNIIAIFGQWGISQFLFSIFIWIALYRYQGLIPLMACMCVLEQILRYTVGVFKPVNAAGIVPAVQYKAPQTIFVIALLAASLRSTNSV
jgi:hypothetical protein